MAVLTETQRFKVWGALMREWQALGQPPTVVKGDIRAAVDATDDWIETNQANFNAALPDPFRSNMSLEQKTLLFCFVALKRAGLLVRREE
jgi:hypothetical protein